MTPEAVMTIPDPPPDRPAQPDRLAPPDRPAYNRALALIAALNAENAPCVLHGLLQAILIASANDIDAAAERHRGGGHQG